MERENAMRVYYNIVEFREGERPREVCANGDRIEHKLKLRWTFGAMYVSDAIKRSAKKNKKPEN